MVVMKLENRTILITGGTSGIGLELARQLLVRGNTVLVTGRDESRLEATRQAVPGLHVYRSDVSDPAAISSLFDTATAAFPRLDVLINNAGIMRNLSVNEPHDLYDITREIDINLSGPIRMIQKFLPHLKAQKASAIINVSSGLAFVPMPISPVYCATKAALHSFTQSLRVQLKGTSVTVVELAPPAVETPLFRGPEFEEEVKGQTGMDAAVLARIAIAKIAADKLEVRPGLANVLAIMSRLAPTLMFNQLAKTVKAERRRLPEAR